MKQRYVVTLSIETGKPVPDLAEKVANRAWTIDGVASAVVLHEDQRRYKIHQPEGWLPAEDTAPLHTAIL